MTLIEDAYEEMVSEYGREFEHYAHQGYSHDFWNDDQGFPDDPTDTFEGQMVMEPHESEMVGQGFMGRGEFVIRTRYSAISEEDLIVLDGNEYKVEFVGRREIQGRTFGYQIEVSSADG